MGKQLDHTERHAAWRRWWASGRAVLVRATVSLIVILSSANIVGAIATFAVAVYVVPEPHVNDHHSVILENTVIGAIYLVIGLGVGIASGLYKLSSLAEWLPSERAPTPEEQLVVLRGPRILARGMAVFWAGAALLFGGLAMRYSVTAGVRIGCIVAISGLITCSVGYRFAELLLREAAGRALSASPHPQRIAQSVAVRAMMTWILGTGAPVFGVMLLGVANLYHQVGTKHDVAFATAILGANCLVAGFLTTFFATRATADPIISVRRALARIERGDRNVRVPVYDGTDVGLLQAGFNRMAAGLEERERIRDLFGIHVGVDVARQALENGVELGGEQREVAVLFIDLVGSTELTHHRPAPEVVELLNRYFAIVIEVVEADGGLINKFAGDSALAIFGAPTPLDDRCTRALHAARTLAQRLTDEVIEVDFGIGVAAGTAVAGNIGGASRLEYTVIGDPVNEAARLAEVGKTAVGRVAASGPVVEQAGHEAQLWTLTDSATMRGRATPTDIYGWVAAAPLPVD